MTRLSIMLVILLMTFAMACDKSPKTNTSGDAGANSSAAQSIPAQSSEAAPASEGNIPGAMPPYAANQPAATAEGMNPPHGQPNHRCDIPVGAPLDSPPVTKPTLPTASSQQIPQIQTTTAPTPTAPGMNPPHGQPNHRCDIAVGAPLDSPPKTKPTAGDVSGQNISLQTATLPTPAPTTPTAPGMNPPHGQPNHRCDIPVGAPLDSAPAKTK